MIKKIKKALGLKTNRELVKKLNETPHIISNGSQINVVYHKIHESQITRWSKNGFHKSTEALLNLLLQFAKDENKSNMKILDGRFNKSIKSKLRELFEKELSFLEESEPNAFSIIYAIEQIIKERT